MILTLWIGVRIGESRKSKFSSERFAILFCPSHSLKYQLEMPLKEHVSGKNIIFSFSWAKAGKEKKWHPTLTFWFNFFILQSKGFPCVHFLPCNLHVYSKGIPSAPCNRPAHGKGIPCTRWPVKGIILPTKDFPLLWTCSLQGRKWTQGNSLSICSAANLAMMGQIWCADWLVTQKVILEVWNFMLLPIPYFF